MITKESVVKELRKSQGMTRQEAAEAVQTVLDFLVKNLSRGEAVELRGFGSFTVRRNPARRCVINGDERTIPAHGRVEFRPGAELKRQVWTRI
jgi:nucleoid DNA-binding protein